MADEVRLTAGVKLARPIDVLNHGTAVTYFGKRALYRLFLDAPCTEIKAAAEAGLAAVKPARVAI